MKTNNTAATIEAARNREVYNKLADIAREVFNHMNAEKGKTYTPADIARAIAGGPVVTCVNGLNYRCDRVEAYALGEGLTWAEGYDPATTYTVAVDSFTCRVNGWRVWDVLDRAARAWSIPARDRATFMKSDREAAPWVVSFTLTATAARELLGAACDKNEPLRPVLQHVNLDTRRRVLVGCNGYCMRVVQLGEALTVAPDAADSYLIPAAVIKSGRVVTIDANGVASTDATAAPCLDDRYPNWPSVVPDMSEAGRVALTAAQWRELKKAVADVSKVNDMDKYHPARVTIAHEYLSNKLHVYAINRDFAKESEATVSIDPEAPAFSFDTDARRFARVGGTPTAFYVRDYSRAVVFTDPAGLSLVMPLCPSEDDKYYMSFSIEGRSAADLLPGVDLHAAAAEIKETNTRHAALKIVAKVREDHPNKTARQLLKFMNDNYGWSDALALAREMMTAEAEAEKVAAETIAAPAADLLTPQGDTIAPETIEAPQGETPTPDTVTTDTPEAVETIETPAEVVTSPETGEKVAAPADTQGDTIEGHSEAENVPQGDTIAPETIEAVTTDPVTIEAPQGETPTPDPEKVAAEIAEAIKKTNETPEAVASRRSWYQEGRAVVYYDIDRRAYLVGTATDWRYISSGEWLADFRHGGLVIIGVPAAELDPAPADPVEMTPATVRAMKTAARTYIEGTDPDDLAINRATNDLHAEGLRLVGGRFVTRATGDTVAVVVKTYGKKRRDLARPCTGARVVFLTWPTPDTVTTDTPEAVETIETPAEVVTSPETGEKVAAPADTQGDTIEGHSEAENVPQGDTIAPETIEAVTTDPDTIAAPETIEAPQGEADTIATTSPQVAPCWSLTCDDLPTADGLTPDTVTPDDIETLTAPEGDTMAEKVAAVLTIATTSPQADTREDDRAAWHLLARRARRVAVAIAATVAACLLLTLTPDRVAETVAAPADLLAPADTIEAVTIADPETVATTDTPAVAVFEATGEAETIAPSNYTPDTPKTSPRARKRATGHRPDTLARVAPADTMKADTLTVGDLLTIEADTIATTGDTLTVADSLTIADGIPTTDPVTIEGETVADPDTIEATGEGETIEGDPVAPADPDTAAEGETATTSAAGGTTSAPATGGTTGTTSAPGLTIATGSPVSPVVLAWLLML